MTINQCLRAYSEKLPLIDIELILEHVCSLSKTELIINGDREITNTGLLEECLEKRLKGYPVPYITNSRYFFKDRFFTTEGVLIPQPDTEILVEEALHESMGFDKIDILDLCAGTGCIGISVAKELCNSCTEVNLVLSDISEKAFNVFKKNTFDILPEKVKVSFVKADLFSGVEGKKFDLVLTNPPYINTDIIRTLPPEVQAEPLLALDGGPDGMKLIRQIIEQVPDFLNENGWLFMEIGYDQGQKTKQLFENIGLKKVSVVKDLSGNDRVVKGVYLGV